MSQSLRDEKQLWRKIRPRLREASEVTWTAESDCFFGFSGSSDQGQPAAVQKLRSAL
jgi:hypothetical protein